MWDREAVLQGLMRDRHPEKKDDDMDFEAQTARQTNRNEELFDPREEQLSLTINKKDKFTGPGMRTAAQSHTVPKMKVPTTIAADLLSSSECDSSVASLSDSDN